MDVGKAFLERIGSFTVDTTISADEALEWVREDRYLAIVSDYQMPVMDGIELLKRIRASGNRIPFILFTGRGREEIAIEALNNGADFYLQKGGDPIAQFTELSNQIHHAIDRNTAERAVREREAKYRGLFDNMNELALILEYMVDESGTVIDGLVQDINRAGLRKLGIGSPADIVGKGVSTIMGPDLMNRFLPYLNKIRDDGQPFVREHNFPLNGRDYITAVNPLGEGQIIVISTDITDIRMAKMAAKESEERFRLIAEQLLDVVYTTDAEGRITYISPSSTKLFGRSPDEMVGRHFMEYLEESSVPKAIREFQATVKVGRPVRNLELLMKHADGGTFIGELTGSPTTNGSNVNGTTGSIRDVSERKLSQMALSEAERNLRRITENMSDLVVELDQHGMTLYASPSHLRLLGIDPDDVVGRSIFDLIWPEDRRLVRDEYEQWMKRGELKEIEYRITDKHGTVHWVHSIGTALVDQGGSAIGAIINTRDVTERRRVEEALHQSEQRLQHAEEVARFGHWSINLDDLSMIGSRGASIIYGLEHKKWSLKEVQSVPLAQYRPLLDKALKELIEDGVPYDVEFKIRRKDDGRILDIHSLAEYDPEKRVVFGVIHDMTETKRAQEAMAHTNDLMRYIIEHSRSALAVFDRNMRYMFVSQRFIDDYEIKDDVVGRYHYDVFPDLPPKWKEVHRRALAGEVISGNEEPCIRDDGSVYLTRWECRPWYLPDRSIGGIILDTEVIKDHL